MLKKRLTRLLMDQTWGMKARTPHLLPMQPGRAVINSDGRKRGSAGEEQGLVWAWKFEMSSGHARGAVYKLDFSLCLSVSTV